MDGKRNRRGFEQTGTAATTIATAYVARHLGIAIRGLVLMAVMLAVFPVTAQPKPFDAAAAREVLERIESRLEAGPLAEERLRDEIRNATNLRSEANACVLLLEPKLARIDGAIAATTTEEQDLQPSKEPVELSRLGVEKADLITRLTNCRLLVLRADDLSAKLSTNLRAIVRDRLFHRDSNIWQSAVGTARDPIQIYEAVREIIVQGSGFRKLSQHLLLAFAFLEFLALALALLARPWVTRQFAARSGEDLASRAARSIGGSFARYLPALVVFVVSVIWGVIVFMGERPKPFAAHLGIAFLTYTIALIVVRGVLAPPRPERQLTPLADQIARSFARRGLSLIALMLIGRTLFVILDSGAIPSDVYNLAGSILGTALIVNLCYLVWLVGYIPRLERSGRGIRVALIFALVVLLCGEWLGYRNMTGYVLTGFIGTVLLLLLYFLVEALFGHLFASLDQGVYGWQKSLRKSLAVNDAEPFPGLFWLRILTALLLWTAGLFVLLRIWGLSDTGTAVFVRYLVDGFQLGNATIVPSKVLTGVFLFLVLLTTFRWFRNALEERWLVATRLDPGARETLVALTSYTGFTIAVLVGLTLAGVGFQNLAIIAGALSLGIGFGLQNIVNNFVSGIILLFERPVRPGDWVVVGATEGYVKKVRVRSTEIQTFDRSDVIVPNSEFISAQVTNWTLRDPYGRVKVPVRVAFGTEPEKVRDLLLQVAGEHPQVVQFGIVPAPVVLFMGFGDNSFNFELRCFIQDINWKLAVTSDLYFAIEKAFRENGIRVPIPQMDMRLHPWSPEAQAIADNAETAAPSAPKTNPPDHAEEEGIRNS